MEKDIAEAIVAKFEDDGVTNVQHRTDYSGRFMFGEKTHAIVLDNIVDLAWVGWIVRDLNIDMEVLHDIRTDSMGMGVVLY